MRQITGIDELTPGKKIVKILGDQCTFWEYLCPHPNNSKYVLFLENLSQNAFKQYIPDLLESDWYIDYTTEEILEREKEWHLKQANKLNEKLKDRKSKKKEEDSSKTDQKG